MASSFYGIAGFRAGDDDLDQFQLDEVGDLTGLDLHLQCHVGLGTLSWARRGARVTGVDFSAPAIEAATAIAEEVGLADLARFVAADALDAAQALGDFVRGARWYESPGSYADWSAERTHDTAVTECRHTLGDVISAVAAAGLRIAFVHEHASIPFQRYGALVARGSRFRYPDGVASLPLMYSLAAR